MKKASQVSRIRSHLLKGNRIDGPTALRAFSCTRLPHVIWTLKNEGMNLRKASVVMPDGTRFASFSLVA